MALELTGEQRSEIISLIKRHIAEQGNCRVGWAIGEVAGKEFGKSTHLKEKVANIMIQSGEYIKEESAVADKDWNILINPQYKLVKFNRRSVWHGKTGVLSQIIVGIFVALVAGGSAPWWWPKVFPPRAKPRQVIQSQAEPLELGMTFEEFGKRYASLEGRFREQEEFIQRAAGKKVHWTVTFRRPASLGDRVQINFGSETNSFQEPVAHGELSITAKDRVYALRRGDVIKIDGILKEYMPNSLTVEVSDFELVLPSPGPSPTK